MAYDDSLQIMTIPDLTLQQSMVLLYHFREGKKTDAGWVNFKNCERDILALYGFQPFDAMTKLREQFQPALLIFEDGLPESNQHRIPRCFFRNPKPLFDAINKAEEAHNALVDKWAAGKNDPTGITRKTMRDPGPKVPITALEAGRAENGRPHQPVATAPTFKIGDIVPTPQGMARIVQGENGPEMELLPIKGAAPSAPPSGGAAAGGGGAGQATTQTLSAQQRGAITRESNRAKAKAEAEAKKVQAAGGGGSTEVMAPQVV